MARRGYPVVHNLKIPDVLPDEVKEEIADFIKSSVLEDISNQTSSVSGKKWQGLSSGYKKLKSKISGSTSANLELYGDMLDSFDTQVRGNTIRVGIFGDETEKAKAENHNYGVTLPQRQFIPGTGETFRKGIRDGIAEIVISSGVLEEIAPEEIKRERISREVLDNILFTELNDESE